MRIYCQPAGTGGVAFYRIIQPFSYIATHCDCDVFIRDQSVHNFQRIKDEMDAADIIVMQMPFGEVYYNEILKNKKSLNPKIMVSEFDDNIFSIHPLNTAYKNFGQDNSIKYYTNIDDMRNEEIIMREKYGIDRKGHEYSRSEQFDIKGKKIVGEMYVWKDGEDGFDLEANRKRMEFSKLTIKESDIVICTTAHLGRILRNVRPKGIIAKLPNLIDFNRWLPMKKNDTEFIRFGWCGGSAHYQDLHMIRKAIWHILDKYPNTKFVLKGAGFAGIFPEKYRDRVEWLAWHGDVNTYPLDIRDMKLDIAVCPVIDDPFNRSKSNLKWLEFSALQVPCVCSETTYGTSVHHNITGFIAKTDNDWIDSISRLIESEELRKKVAMNAYNRVKEKFNVEHSTMWYELFRDYKHKAINSLKVVKNANTKR